ncbi:hypothetical protein FACS1894127_5280 [Clostridia bacterium]|nr:hypothetical protein FACS1894127_5280 [Clostridia bacterium]
MFSEERWQNLFSESGLKLKLRKIGSDKSGHWDKLPIGIKCMPESNGSVNGSVNGSDKQLVHKLYYINISLKLILLFERSDSI